MDTYTVSLFGHRQLKDPKKARSNLKKFIRKLLSQYEHVEFLVGENGDFTQAVISILHKDRKSAEFDRCSLVLVLPFPTEDYLTDRNALEKIFDRIEIYGSDNYNSVGWDRNVSMMDQSDLVVCCIERKSSDTYNCFDYARRTGKQTVNIARPMLFTSGI